MSARHATRAIPNGHHARRATWNDRSEDLNHSLSGPRVFTVTQPCHCVAYVAWIGGSGSNICTNSGVLRRKVPWSVLEGLKLWRKHACRSAQAYDWFNARVLQGNMTITCSSRVNPRWLRYADVPVNFEPTIIRSSPGWSVNEPDHPRKAWEDPCSEMRGVAWSGKRQLVRVPPPQ